MRLLIFIAVIIGIAVVFGLVYGISALVDRKRGGSSRGSAAQGRGPRTKSVAPDDDPEFLRNVARKLAEQEFNKNVEPGSNPDLKPGEPGSNPGSNQGENDK
jgi:hypothetical protein